MASTHRALDLLSRHVAALSAARQHFIHRRVDFALFFPVSS
jgi:hypothetical protein